MPVHVENDNYYDEVEDTLLDDDVEDTSMEIDLDKNPDVNFSKLPPGPTSNIYSPEEENILIKLKLGNCSMEEVQTCKEQLRNEQWNQSEDLPNGWMFKMFGENLKLLGRGGELFENMNEAFEFVEKYQSYFSRDDVMKIFVFGEDKSSPPEQKELLIKTEESVKAEDIKEEIQSGS